MPSRFAILHHESPQGDHWDIMLENAGMLTTWSLPPQSVMAAPFSCTGVRIPDHRIAYLDYEGPISDNRGTVRRVDRGTYVLVCASRFRLNGGVFVGELSIEENGDGSFRIGFVPEESAPCPSLPPER